MLRASRARVWRAISEAAEFGSWFGVMLEGPFVAGATTRGRITHPGYEHLTCELQVARIDAGRHLAFRWHPYAVDPAMDYSAEPTTLVEFILDDAPGATPATRVTIVESGFDRIPLTRSAEAFRMNEGGWTAQIVNLERHVAS